MKKMMMAAIGALMAGMAFSGGKPVALMGFGTDVKAMKFEITDQCRYESELMADKWVDPADYGRYSVLYFGEKLRGEAQGKNWIGGEAQAAAEKFLAGGGTVIVAGRSAMNELFGKPSRKRPHPLRDKVIYIPESYGRMLVNFARAKKPLSFPDDAGNDILTAEGREAKALQDKFIAAFAKAKGVARMPEGEKWENVPLGAPGTLKLPTAFRKRPKLGKAKVRGDGIVLLDGAAKAAIVVPSEESECRKLAEELKWHLEQMAGVKFDITDRVPEKGSAIIYRTLACPKGFPRGESAYFKIWREGDRLIVAGENTGKSRATTYVLEALGCRYLWPGASGKVIPKKTKIVLPDIAVEDATPLVIRRARLYRQPEHIDHPGNRDFWRWHGMNDMKFMTSDKPGESDGYQWGHYYKDYYPKYSKTKPKLFALQPDGTRNLHLGSHPERPTFCLSNPELAEITASRKIAEFNAAPQKKALSLCLPDGATSSWCLCEECRRMDPVNAAKGSVTVFFPVRKSLPYVAFTDRVFAYMNSVAEKVAAVHPSKLLATYAYSCYTAAPVSVRPHPNLLILSVAGNYSNYANDGVVERNLVAWKSFGNKVLWRPNAHGGFRVTAPDNFARRMFADISLLVENHIFGVDYDTMYSDWSTKSFTYYITTKAHFNPDRLDFETFADDYCRHGFGAAAKDVREFYDLGERASTAAARLNAEDKTTAVNWAQRVKRQNRLLETLDFDALDACLARARAAAAGDEAVLKRIARLQFGTDLGRFTAKKRINRPSAPTEEERVSFRKRVTEYLAIDPAAHASHKAVSLDF